LGKKNKGKTDLLKKYGDDVIGIIFIALGVMLAVGLLDIGETGKLGFLIERIFVGFFGTMAVTVPVFLVLCGIYYISKKGEVIKKSKLVLTLALIVLMSAIISISDFSRNDYINMGVFKFIANLFIDGFLENSGEIYGGFIGNLISYPLVLIFGETGTIIMFVALAIICLVILTNISLLYAFNVFAKTITNIFSCIKNLFKKDDKPSKDDIIKDFDKLVSLRESDNSINQDGLEKKDIEFKGKLFEQSELSNKKEEKKDNKKDNKIEEKIEIDTTDKGDLLYTYPSLDFLNRKSISNVKVKDLKEAALEGARKLENTLKSFGVIARVVNISKGPAITRYELQPNVGVKVSKIVNLSDDIALNLATTGIRIEAPIPGKAAIGIEVPNKESVPVLISEVLDSDEFRSNKSKVAFALGKDVSGENVIADIAKMPHVLIAGATGSGKSVCINSIIISLLYKASPYDVRLLMIDPKVVELGIYNGIPHLLIPVVTDAKKAAGALNWAVGEMIKRYKMFASKGVRDINGYNSNLDESNGEKKLPQIVIIIDELSDLMMVSPHEVEDSICRLAQMARAAGMHLVIATQRPSVDVITGVIKANIPSRIAFSVSSQVDSRTIIDMAGAERLLGKGDMLYFPVGEPKPIRVKGVFVTDKEVERVVDYIKSSSTSEYDDGIIDVINKTSDTKKEKEDDCDELLEPAIELVVGMGQASASLIQRKFKVGYARAARIIDELEEKGVIGEYEGSKPRQVKWTKEILAEYIMAKSDKKD